MTLLEFLQIIKEQDIRVSISYSESLNAYYITFIRTGELRNFEKVFALSDLIIERRRFDNSKEEILKTIKELKDYQRNQED